MKGFRLIGASITCMDCDFSEQDIKKPDWYYHASEAARKHHEKTGHTVMVELVFSKTYEKEVKA